MIKLKKAVFNRAGKYCAVKACIPLEWAAFLGITPDSPEITLELSDRCIIIKKGMAENGEEKNKKSK